MRSVVGTVHGHCLVCAAITLASCTTELPGVDAGPDFTAVFAMGCTSGFQDGDETDVDCGGSCAPCGDGKKCADGKDCGSGICINRTCAAASCSDGFKNGAESDIDCGASCPTKCAEGKACGDGPDCASGTCVNEVCAKSACLNAMKDGVETDVDCGGGMCPACTDGKACLDGPDCTSGMCVNKVCKGGGGTCSDGQKNGTETDVDCGGRGCPKCADGKGCIDGPDCTSGMCVNNVCKGTIVCGQGMGNCDGSDANGCEANLMSDAKNCGACGNVCPVNTPTCSAGHCSMLYTFSGIQQNLPVGNLVGWEQCYRDVYSTRGTNIKNDILAKCNRDRLLLACRQTGSQTLQVAAMADRADVIFDVGNQVNGYHDGNGVRWYFSDNYSWGFLQVGDTPNRNHCDADNTNGQFKLCWPTTVGIIDVGYRCGGSITTSSSWERLVFHAN